MFLLDKQLPLSVWLDSPWNQLGLGIIALSFIPAAGAFRLFGKVKTTPKPFQPEKAHELLAGLAVYLGSLVSLLIPPLFMWLMTTKQIKREEMALEKIFELDYLDYKQKVRRWL